MKRFLVLLLGVVLAATAVAEEWAVRLKAAGSFEDARDAVVAAIENRGLVINYTSHIADMLARTGADLGATRQIFERAEIVEFCSARLSRQMMEADPHNIILCPFAVSIYTLPGETGTVWLAYRKPPARAGAAVEGLLQAIVAEAVR